MRPEEYRVIFETECTWLTPIEFNLSTISFNNLFFGEGSTRRDSGAYLKLNQINPFMHLYAVTHKHHDVIGALEIYPLEDWFIDELTTGSRYDRFLSSDSIPSSAFRAFNTPGPYRIFVNTIAIHPQFRTSFSIAMKLFDHYFRKMIMLAERDIYISEVYGETWSTSGSKLASFLGMRPVRTTRNGTLYMAELSNNLRYEPKAMPTSFQDLLTITKTTRDKFTLGIVGDDS